MSQLQTKDRTDAPKQLRTLFLALDFGKMMGANQPAKHLRIPSRVVLSENISRQRLIRETVAQTQPGLAEGSLTLLTQCYSESKRSIITRAGA